MSKATSSSTSAPATCTAASVIPSRENNHRPARANPLRIRTATRQAVRAIRNRWGSVYRDVMARKAGTVAMGSTITKRELNASTPYSVGVMRSSGSSLPEQLGPRVGMRAFGQPLVQSALLVGDGRWNDDVQIE